jgi:pimeloyl-ACP methyl ester carboxylesterase
MEVAERAVEILPPGIIGDLTIPANATGIVVFAHGTGSSRFSERNRFVAHSLQQGGFATLLLDLLTAAEEEIDVRTRHLRFDVRLLAERLIQTTEWLRTHPDAQLLPVGYFGASTGAAAALLAASQLPNVVKAVVSRGGRPDLAGEALKHVKSPTLLIVGERDDVVVELNARAFVQLGCQQREVRIVPGATHLFEEPGALKEVASLALDWFQRYLS